MIDVLRMKKHVLVLGKDARGELFQVVLSFKEAEDLVNLLDEVLEDA